MLTTLAKQILGHVALGRQEQDKLFPNRTVQTIYILSLGAKLFFYYKSQIMIRKIL